MGCKPDEAPKKRFSLLQKSTGEIYEPLMSASTRTVGSSCGGEDGAEPWWKRGTAAAAAAMMMHRDDDYDQQRCSGCSWCSGLHLEICRRLLWRAYPVGQAEL